MKLLEAKLQQDCVKWLVLQYPHALFYHAPNEGKRSFAYWSWLKGLGTRAGFPDLVILEACGPHIGLAVEFKAGKGKTTDNQEHWLLEMQKRGWITEVCRSLEEFQATVRWYIAEGIDGKHRG